MSMRIYIKHRISIELFESIPSNSVGKNMNKNNTWACSSFSLFFFFFLIWSSLILDINLSFSTDHLLFLVYNVCGQHIHFTILYANCICFAAETIRCLVFSIVDCTSWFHHQIIQIYYPSMFCRLVFFYRFIVSEYCICMMHAWSIQLVKQ